MLKYYALMTVAAFFWGGSFIAGKYAIQDLSAMEIAFFRFGLALIFFIPITRKHVFAQKLSISRHFQFMLVGALTIFAYHYLFFDALKYTSAVSASFIIALNPIITTLLAAIYFREERITPQKALGTLVSFVGVSLIITNGNWQVLWTLNGNKGDVMMLGAVLCWSLSIVLSRRFFSGVNARQITFFSTLYGLLFFLPFIGSSAFLASTPSASTLSWASIAYMALFSTVAAYIFYYDSIQVLGPSKTSLMLNLVPIFAAGLSVAVLGETISSAKLFGALLVFFGIYLVIGRGKP